MKQRKQVSEAASTSTVDELPDLLPWRQIGWIFRDGNCIAIERQGEETRARPVRD
jgi:hypothetical protein